MATYYVRPNGLDTNTGTGPATNQAFKTITKAFSKVVAGDTVYVAPGMYRESNLTTANDGSSGALVKIIADGTATQFTDMQPGEVIISGLPTDASAPVDNSIIRLRAYTTLDGFTIQDCGYYNGAIYANNPYVKIYNCKLIRVSRGMFFDSNADYPDVANCYIHSRNYDAIAHNGIRVLSLTDSIIKATGAYAKAIFVQNGDLSMQMCTVEGSIHINGLAGSTSIYGCILKKPGTVYAGSEYPACIVGNLNKLHRLDVRGCLFLGQAGSWGIRINEFLSLRIEGCKFDGFDVAYRCTSNTVEAGVINNCEIANCYRGFEHLQNTYAITANAIVFNAVTMDQGTPVGVSYGSAANQAKAYSCATIQNPSNIIRTALTIDDKYGHVYDTVAPISGRGSLRIRGCGGYSPVYIVWVPCEAGKPKTVTFKAKRTTITGSTPGVRFGKSTKQFAATTDIQTISITYTHHATELVPMFIKTYSPTAANYTIIDDIKF